MLRNGLYEQIINKSIKRELEENDNKHQVAAIDAAEASKILSRYIAEVTEKKLENITDNGGDVSDQVKVVNRLICAISAEREAYNSDELSIADKQAQQLLAIYDNIDNIRAFDGKTQITRPETSIAMSSLFTGAVREPQMYSELKREILSCDRIDMLVSFIKWSGLRLIIEELRQFTQNGGKLRVITTSYMGATDIKAVEELRKLPNTKIKVSYDTKRTRLHAKTYVFYRNTGFTTAYVGSSNLSNAAISSGLEWNVKVTKKDLPETIDKIDATFESYWNSNEFEYYNESQTDRLCRALNTEKFKDKNNPDIYTIDITPYSYQQEILDKLEAERKVRGCFRNLVVSATGTGKTVISAFDYKRFRRENKNSTCRLLFVAHREEILSQSLYTFRAILKDANFGEMFVGGSTPESIDNLFVSIQTFNSREFTEKTSKTFYDYIVIDEFHHAAAPSYQRLLEHYEPKVMLGLTATPERMDGKNILPYFNNRIAAEIRLPEAIERKLLSPFQYFGVSDTVDLDKLKWSAGGYDRKELSNIYTINQAIADKRADHVVSSLMRYVSDIDEVKGLGFCVSVEHAAFMADFFTKRGIKSIFLTAKSLDEERKSAAKRLIAGEIKFIFIVDIYNEGVDIPEVNTILFLRPTESLTIFLQQLGRGLRLAENKECLTVLDFIGAANKKYRFEDKFASLLANTKHNVTYEIKHGFVSLPKGCYIQLEKIAARHILDNIHASYSGRAALIAKIMAFSEDSGKPLTYADFLNYHHIDMRYIYKFSSFARLCADAGVCEDFNEPLEGAMTTAFSRFAFTDSRRWINFIIRILENNEQIFNECEERMLQMFQFTLWQKPSSECGFASPADGIAQIKQNPVMCTELLNLLKYRLNKIDFVDEPVDVGFDCPLDLHCTYTRDQIFAALDVSKPNTIREGVKWLPEKKIDVLLVTLNKSDKDYSPTTMYKDYSINDVLFHWQSQSTTADDSVTGKRYHSHKSIGSKILLFVREFKTENVAGKAEAYTFLGKANYVSHTGSKPMNVIWKLEKPIAAKFLKKTNKLAIV